MAGTNPDAPVIDDDKPVSEADLRALKYPNEGVEPPVPPDADEPEPGNEDDDEPTPPADDDDQIVPPAPDADEPPGDEPTGDEPPAPTPPAFVKEFDYIKGDTPEEYAKNLEAAYKNSSSEALRLKDRVTELEAPKTTPPADDQTPIGEVPPATPTPKSPTDLYVQQKLDEEIQSAFAVVQKDFPQVNDPAEYAKFTREVQTFSRTILDTQGRLASPGELYGKAAISLGWEKNDAPPTEDEKLKMALKGSAGSGRPSASGTPPKAPAPKISEAEMVVNRKMYPGKTDKEIIDELTPYHQS